MAQTLNKPVVPLRRPATATDEHDAGVVLSSVSTFVECFPRKVKTGGPHPHTIVETASMSAVEPPDVRISLAIPEVWIDSGALSCVQMEAVVYACQSHEAHLPNGWRRGFLIGDGAGVGKGRTIAGIIVHNYELGRRRSIWLSVSSDLRLDAQRDIQDVAGANYCPIYQLTKFKYGSIREQQHKSSRGIMFATYASLVGKSKAGQSRLNQLIEWFGADFDGVIVFDECHRAKNLCPKAGSNASSMIGRCVVDLQRALPQARIVYASATGATEPRNMAYMERLGIWGSGTVFNEFGDFLDVVERRGMGAMELVAMDMKRRGLYIARQLSFHGVDFDVLEVPITAEFKHMYNEAVAFWIEMQNQFQRAFNVLAAQNKKSCKAAWTHFYSAGQRFFKHLCIAVKVPMCVEIAKKAIDQGKCVVIGLQSTGESQTNEALDDAEGDLEEFVSTLKQLLLSLIEKYFPIDHDDTDRDVLESEMREVAGEGRRSKRKHHKFDFDAMENEAKRQKLIEEGRYPDEDDSENDEEDDEEEDDELDNDDDERNSESSDLAEDMMRELADDTSDHSDDGEDGNDGMDASKDDFVQELMDELSSSDEDDGSEAENENSDTEGSKKDDELCDDSIAVNLFCMDFNAQRERKCDPWASRQRLVSDDSYNKELPGTIEQVKRSVKKSKKGKKEKTVEKIGDFAKKRRMDLKAEEGDSSINYERGEFNDQLFTMDLNSLRSEDVTPTLQLIKDELLDRAAKLGDILPINTLDALIDDLGGTDAVAEMTGRRGRVVRMPDGSTIYKRRNDGETVTLDMINVQEKDYFMNEQKLIAIISEAASSGISLHADRRAMNKRRRVHITLELPWSADRAVQQFGRTHRSNQEYPPEYLFLISELAGEKRFVSTASKRLQSLGALTHGDRRAVAESDDLARFSVENKYGKNALQHLYNLFLNPSNCLIRPTNALSDIAFFEKVKGYLTRSGVLKSNSVLQINADRGGGAINKFLNRLLMMPVDVQNSLFDYYMTVFLYLVQQAKRDGTYDNGTMELGSTTDHVFRTETRVFSGFMCGFQFELHLHQISVDRGMSWADVKALADTHPNGHFVFGHATKTNRVNPCFVYPSETSPSMIIIRPNTGRTTKAGNIVNFLSNHRKFANIDDARKAWELQYSISKTICLHEFNNGVRHPGCEIGRRVRNYFILGGAVLTAWQAVEHALSHGRRTHIQIVRIQTAENQKLVGVLVSPNVCTTLIKELQTSYNASHIRTY